VSHWEVIEQIKRQAAPCRTICEVLRELWDLSEVTSEDLREEMQARLVDAYVMAKKMARKLREYKHQWPEDFWQANTDYEEDLRRRSDRPRSKT